LFGGIAANNGKLNGNVTHEHTKYNKKKEREREREVILFVHGSRDEKRYINNIYIYIYTYDKVYIYIYK